MRAKAFFRPTDFRRVFLALCVEWFYIFFCLLRCSNRILKRRYFSYFIKLSELYSFTMEQFDQLLTCPICLDRYKNPKLLPCQHSFCFDPCMEGLIDYVRRQVGCFIQSVGNVETCRCIADSFAVLKKIDCFTMRNEARLLKENLISNMLP